MCIGKIVFAWCYNIKNADSQRGINLVVNHFRMLSRDHPVADEGSTNTGLSQVIGGDQLGYLHGHGRMDTGSLKKCYGTAVQVVAGRQKNEWSICKGFHGNSRAFWILIAPGKNVAGRESGTG